MKNPELVIVGHIGINRTDKPDGKPVITYGGAGYYAAVGASVIQDCQTGIVSQIGSGDQGEEIVSLLHKFGINTDGVTRVPRGSTASFRQQEDERGRRSKFQGDMGVAESISATTMPMEFKGAQWFHLPTAPPTQLITWIDGLESLRILPSHISVDTFETYARRDPEATKAVMERVGLVFLNGEEYAVMVRHFGEEFFHRFPHVLKLGKRGAVYMDKTKWPEIQIEMPAMKVATRDTTGAGEVLAGVFNAARVAGLSVPTSLRLSVDTATRSVSRPGVEHIRDGMSNGTKIRTGNDITNK